MTGAIIILIVLLVASYLLSGRNIFSPGMLTGSIFAFCLLTFVVLPHQMPPLHKQCLTGIILWSSCFIVSALLMQSFRYTRIEKHSSYAIVDLYFWLSIACIPLLMRFAYLAITTGSSANFATNLRMAAVHGLPNGTPEPYTPFYYMLWLATYLLYLKDISKEKWRRTVIMSALVLAFGLVTMSKTFILTWGVITLFILFHKKMIAARHILIGVSILIAGMVGMQIIRQHMAVDEEHMSSMFELYVMANFNAFDTLHPCSAEHWGEHVFRLYYVLAQKLGLSAVEPVNPILPWVYTPVATNTYTVLYPFFLDFGYPGIAVFGVLLGGGIGWLYSHCRQNEEIFVLLYAYFCVLLITQYSGEAFFTNLAGNIKFVLVLLVPYLTFPIKRVAAHE